MKVGDMSVVSIVCVMLVVWGVVLIVFSFVVIVVLFV